jgi:hypothetical protein
MAGKDEKFTAITRGLTVISTPLRGYTASHPCGTFAVRQMKQVLGFF